MDQKNSCPVEAVEQFRKVILDAYKQQRSAMLEQGVAEQDLIFVLFGATSQITWQSLAEMAAIKPDKAEQDGFFFKMMLMEVKKAAVSMTDMQNLTKTGLH